MAQEVKDKGEVVGLIAFKFENQTVRTSLDEHGEPLFVAKDACELLGISKHRDAVSRLRGNVTRRMIVDGFDMTLVSEAGLYQLIFRSKKPDAEKFQNWITSEVLPSIRKTGSYSIQKLTPLQQMRQSLEIMEAQEARLSGVEAEIIEVKRLAIQASSHNSANTGFMTIRGYCNIHGIKLGLKESQKIGRECSSLARSHGAETRKTDDEMFGSVKSYPVGIIDEVFSHNQLSHAN